MPLMNLQKRTKIVCTIGPATHTQEMMVKLVGAGMNVCRLNFSHGTHEDHSELIERIREVRKKTGEPLTILQDLQGPKIRVGELPKEGVVLEAGKQIIFTTGTSDIPQKLPVTYAALHKDVQAGQHILLDDGLMAVRVLEVKRQDVICEVVNGGTLTSHKGMNLPETKTSISAMSDKDREDVVFGVLQGVDWIALSFVRSADDLRELRRVIASAEETNGASKTTIRIMAKIEKPEALENIDAIIAEADGIMVARGDLGIEIPAEKVPVAQKQIITKCLEAAKPVIVATQMLDSMIRNPRPTRAEISDVANAVIDHADATMLSGETASGAYPVEAVEIMAKTIKEAEASTYDDLPVRERIGKTNVAGNVAALLAKSSGVKAIVVASLSGESARTISRYRPEMPIFAAIHDDRTLHQLNVSWGVRPFLVEKSKTVPQLLERALKALVKQRYLASGDQIIVVAGEPLETKEFVTLVELRTV